MLLLPLDDPSLHIDSIQSLRIQEARGLQAADPTPAIDQICVFWTQLRKRFFEITEGYVGGVGDERDGSFFWGADVNQFEFGVFGILGDQLHCRLHGNAHPILINKRRAPFGEVLIGGCPLVFPYLFDRFAFKLQAITRRLVSIWEIINFSHRLAAAGELLTDN